MARRYFIGVATTGYSPHTGLRPLPKLAAELESAGELFAGLGYAIVPDFGLDLPASAFKQRLRRFLRDPQREADDVIVVYYTGHGELAASGRDLLLPMADATEDKAFSYLRAGDLTGRLLDSDEPGEMVSQQLLYILDTCYAGAAGSSLAEGAANFVGRLRAASRGPSVAVIVAAREYQQAGLGAFTRALVKAVKSRSVAGHEVRHVPLEPLVARVNELMTAESTVAGRQHARLLYIGEQSGAFFPNPRFDEWDADLDVRTRDIQKEREARQGERDRAARAEQGLPSFTGRHVALRQVTEWIAGRGTPTMVVTGGPGSGKSALLARVDTLADPRRRARIPETHLLPPDTIPPFGSVSRFIHARGLTPLALLAGLAEACGIEDIAAVDSPGQLVSRLRDRPGLIRVIVDGVDEAAPEPGDPARGGMALVDTVLAPLVRQADRIPLRLLIGTRSTLVAALGPQIEVIDLDRARYADRASLQRYVQLCLTDLVEGSPYQQQPPRYLSSVVDAVSAAAGDSFLVGLIISRSLALREKAVADPDDVAWRRSLPREAAAAMLDDLNARLKDQADRARDLLLPLAYAQGAGLPWEDLWPWLVTRLTGRTCGNGDLDWLIERAGYYVIETQLGSSSAYRLYHASLGSALTEGRNAKADHALVMETLLDRVPVHGDGARDWRRAHPYTASAIASHASQADRVDDLLADPRVLVETSPGPLLNALPSAKTSRMLAVGDAFRRAVGRMQAHKDAGAAYLQLAARCARAPQLADDIATSGLHLPWTTHWASWRMQPPHHTLTDHDGPVTAVALGEHGDRMIAATGSVDRCVRLYYAATGRPFGEPLIGHEDWVTSVAFGQWGGRTHVISGGDDRTIRVWDVATGRELEGRRCKLQSPVRCVAFGELSGQPMIVAGDEEGVVSIWDAAERQFVREMSARHTGAVQAVAWGELHGRAVVVSGGADGKVQLADVATGRQAAAPFTGHEGRVRAVDFGRLGDETIVVSGGDDQKVQVWRADSGEPVTDPYLAHGDSVNAVAFGRRGTQAVVVSAGTDQVVRMWDVVTGYLIGTGYHGHTDAVRAVAFKVHKGHPIIVSGGEDETVRLWDAALNEPMAEPFTGHTEPVNSVAIGELAGQPVVVSAGDDLTIRLWDTASGQPICAPLQGHTDPVSAIAFTTLDGQPTIASGGEDGTVRLWNVTTGDPVGPPLDGMGHVRAVAFGRLDDRPVLAAGGSGEAVHLWDALSLRPLIPPLEGHEGAVNSIAFGDLDGRTVVASASDDGTVRLWEAASGSPVGEPLTGHGDAVTSVAFAAVNEQTMLVSGSEDQTVRLWNPASGEQVSEPLTGLGAVSSVAFGELGHQPVIVTGGADPSLRISDATSRELVNSFFAGSEGLSSVAFGRWGRQPVVVAGGADNALRAWDASTGRVLAAPFSGHRGPVTAVAFGRLDGKLVVVSASTDYSVRLWNAGTGAPLNAPILGHADSIRSVAFGHVQGRAVIASAGDDRTIRLWEAATGIELARFHTPRRSSVNSVVLAELDGRAVIASGSNDRYLCLWDVQSRRPLFEVAEAHHGYVSSVAFGQLRGEPVIASGGKDQVVRLWDAHTGSPLGSPLDGHTDEITGVALGTGTERLLVVSAGNDGTVRHRDAATGETLLPPFAGHGDWVRTVAVGQRHDRAVIVSGGIDQSIIARTVELDDLGEARLVNTTRIELTAVVNCVAVHDTSHLVVATDLGLVSISLKP